MFSHLTSLYVFAFDQVQNNKQVLSSLKEKSFGAVDLFRIPEVSGQLNSSIFWNSLPVKPGTFTDARNNCTGARTLGLHVAANSTMLLFRVARPLCFATALKGEITA